MIRNKKGVFRSIFTDHLADENVDIMIALTEAKKKYKLIKDDKVTYKLLRKNRVVFMHTTERNHAGTVELLEPFLKASGLEDID